MSAPAVRERFATGMAWAVDKQSGEPVYVGKLGGEHTGLRCNCICPACDARLQAVGVGHADPRRAPFFRHHQAEQGPGCKFRMAEMAALRLLFQSGLIEIPAPRKHSEYRGASGRLYPAERVGEAIEEAVVERRLISAAQAILTLASGRQVALVLRGHQDVGELGSVFAVIEVQVSDPEVALLSPEEILARSELRGEWLHLVKHHNDQQVQQLADDAARAQAAELYDIDPTELGLPVGATAKQASESLIHWAVKDALLRLGTLMAPGFHGSASATAMDGTLHTVEVTVPPTMLRVSDVVDEVLLDGYKPDILCSATAVSGDLGQFRLVVEVALTSKVTATKLALVERDGLACIELDVRRFAEGSQRVPLSRLVELVRTDLACKAWLHHPQIGAWMRLAQAKAEQARDEADRRAAAARQAALAERRREEERARAEARTAERKASWVSTLGREQTLQELRLVLERRWASEMLITSNGMTWDEGEFEQLAQSNLAPHRLGRLITAQGGVAWRLSEIVKCIRGERQSLDLSAVVGVDYGLMRWDLEPWLGLFYLAIEHYKVDVEADQVAEHLAGSQAVLASLRSGKAVHARPGGYDEVLTGLFPELRDVLELELGTLEYSKRVERERAAAATAAKAAQEAEAEAAAAAEALRKADEAAERERQRLPNAVSLVCYQMAWKPNRWVPKSAEQAVEFLRYSPHKDADQWTRDLVADGWRARAASHEFKEWFGSTQFPSVEAVALARGALEAAFLIEIRRH